MNLLPGWAPPPGRPTKTDISYVTRAHSTASNNFYDFGTLSFGEPHPDRYIIAVYGFAEGTNEVMTFDSASIGGQPTTIVKSFSRNGVNENMAGCMIAIAHVPEGASGNVTAFINDGDVGAVAIFRAIAPANPTTPADTEQQGGFGVSTSINFSLSVPAKGFGIAVMSMFGGGDVNFSGMTKIIGETVFGSNDMLWGIGLVTPVEAPQNISGTVSGFTDSNQTACLCAAAWAPRTA